MKPPADEAPTEVELEVARILCKLPKLFHKAESRRLPDFLRWGGGRRRRSALDDDITLLEPPPPPPSISPPPHGNVEKKDGDRGCSGVATSSPATPLSFPASGGEEPDGRPPRPLSSPPSKVFKTTKRHMEWVEKQNRLIASLSDENAQLQRSIAEFDAMYQELKARNSWLQDLQSKMMARKSMEEEGQKQQQQDGGSGLAPLGPTTLQSPATRSLVDPHNQRWEIQPPPVDRNGGTPSPSVVAVGRWPEKMAALDLNASPEEEEEEEWERSSAYKAAMSAQAKKRRLEIIQHEKNNNYSSSSFFSMAQTRPRLR